MSAAVHAHAQLFKAGPSEPEVLSLRSWLGDVGGKVDVTANWKADAGKHWANLLGPMVQARLIPRGEVPAPISMLRLHEHILQ